ncbi:hypothetical protein HY346_01080 [Candidatus Microgenomates bacterium]|nr:hypothetical protein [Candidatus Microgenomates bacterium]
MGYSYTEEFPDSSFEANALVLRSPLLDGTLIFLPENRPSDVRSGEQLDAYAERRRIATFLGHVLDIQAQRNLLGETESAAKEIVDRRVEARKEEMRERGEI